MRRARASSEIAAAERDRRQLPHAAGLDHALQQLLQRMAQRQRVLAARRRRGFGDRCDRPLLEQERDLGRHAPRCRPRSPAAGSAPRAAATRPAISSAWSARRVVEATGQQPGVDLGRLQRRQPRRQRPSIVGGRGFDHASSRPTRRPVGPQSPESSAETAVSPSRPARRGVWQAMRGAPRSRSAIRSATRRSATAPAGATSAARSSSSPHAARLRDLADDPPAAAAARHHGRLGPGRSDVDQQRQLGRSRQRLARPSLRLLVDGHRTIPSQSTEQEADAIHQQRQPADQQEAQPAADAAQQQPASGAGRAGQQAAARRAMQEARAAPAR